MKSIVFINNSQDGNRLEETQANGSHIPGWCLLADSAVSNTGKPFYLPDLERETRGSLVFAVKISRLGKGISPKFSHRYYSEIAPAVNFWLPTLEAELRGGGLPDDAARNFDRALMVGEFGPFDPGLELTLRINGQEACRASLKALTFSLDECLAEISKFNTLKMGDLLIPDRGHGIPLEVGNLLEIFSGDEKAFHIKIK
ncbi:MAG: fumarylacetoacetate hydrolase family protein [Muribaculaceae bacterium]|nr:fumarylacetoacetate hydrolase family protein [Muribaculaceae bacterium]